MSYTSYASYTLLIEEISRKVSEHFGLSCKDVTEFLMKEMTEEEKKEDPKEVKSESKKDKSNKK